MSERKVHPDVIRYGLEEMIIYIARGDYEQAALIGRLLSQTTPQEDRVEAARQALGMTTQDLYARIWASVHRKQTVDEV